MQKGEFGRRRRRKKKEEEEGETTANNRRSFSLSVNGLYFPKKTTTLNTRNFTFPFSKFVNIYINGSNL